MRALLPLLSSVVVLVAGCGNKCSFSQRCNGNVLEQCGEVDQVVNRDVISSPCVAPNESCVELDDRSATCVHGAPTPCDGSFVQRCDGAVRVFCGGGAGDPKRFVVAEDCGAAKGDGGSGGTCFLDATGRAVCR